jgi:hypothetical protein
MVAVPAVAHLPHVVAVPAVVGAAVVVMLGMGAVIGRRGQRRRGLVEALAFAGVRVVVSVGHRCTSSVVTPALSSAVSSAPTARVSVIS